MNRLEEIQNELAVSKGFKSFNDMDSDADLPEMDSIYNESAVRYAEECVKASLEKASEVAECEYDYFVDKKSITNPENIILL